MTMIMMIMTMMIMMIMMINVQVSAMMPPTSDTPLIGIYFSLIMVMVACSVVCTVLILNYHKRTVDTHTMPPWVETVFLYWLPWLLRMEHMHKADSLSSFMSEIKMVKSGDLQKSAKGEDLVYGQDYLGKT